MKSILASVVASILWNVLVVVVSIPLSVIWLFFLLFFATAWGIAGIGELLFAVARPPRIFFAKDK